MPNIVSCWLEVTTENRELIDKIVATLKEALHTPDCGESRFAPNLFQKAWNLTPPTQEEVSRSWLTETEDMGDSVIISADCAWSDWNQDSNESFMKWLAKGIHAIDNDATICVTSEVKYEWTEEGKDEAQ